MEAMPESAIKRLRRLAADCVGPRSAATGTELALMHLRGELSEAQLEAARTAVEARGAYLRTLGVRQLKAMVLEPSGGPSNGIDPDSEAGAGLTAKERAAWARYNRIRAVIIGCGRRARLSFEAVAYEDAVPSWSMRIEVQRVAEALRFAREQRRRVRRVERKRA